MAKSKSKTKKKTKKAQSNKQMKILIIAAVVIVLIIAAVIAIEVASGNITPDEIIGFINKILDLGEPQNSISPSPSPVLGELTDEILLIGDPLTGALLTVHFIDVAQGDSIFIEFPDGKNMLIDGGDRRTETRDKILLYLSELGVTNIDYLMLTHTHADHVGYLDQIIAVHPATTYYIPNLIASYGMEDSSIPQSVSTRTYKNFIDQVEEYDQDEEFDIVIIYNEDILMIEGEDYTMMIYSPPPEFYTNFTSSSNNNNMSPICLLEYGGRTMVFTGDAETVAEQRFVDQVGDPIDADVLKVAHHGSHSSSNSFFLDFIDVEYAVISCGKNNSHRHPRQAALDALIESGVEYIFRTDMHSDILLEVDKGGNMQFTVVNYVSMELVIVGYE